MLTERFRSKHLLAYMQNEVGQHAHALSHTYAREHKLQTALVHWESKSLSLSQLYFSFWLRSHTEDARGSFVFGWERERDNGMI